MIVYLFMNVVDRPIDDDDNNDTVVKRRLAQLINKRLNYINQDVVRDCVKMCKLCVVSIRQCECECINLYAYISCVQFCII